MEKVLIVHESAAFRSALRCKLNLAGFNCIEARDALAGLQRAIEDRPVALIIDASLRGLDGSEMRGFLASERATRHLPVLLCEEGALPGHGDTKTPMGQGDRIDATAGAEGWQSALRGVIDTAAAGSGVGLGADVHAPAQYCPASLN